MELQTPAVGRLVVISGPSGAGKSSVVSRLLETCSLPLELSVSATTRKKRPGEVDGRHYHFIDRPSFLEKKAAGEFLECKEVFGRGDWYGTLAGQVQKGLDLGRWVILEIDVQGALQVMEHRSDLVSFFIHPGSLIELEQRLRKRGTEQERDVVRRLEVAKEEMAAISAYGHEVINDEVNKAAKFICQTLESEAQRLAS